MSKLIGYDVKTDRRKFPFGGSSRQANGSAGQMSMKDRKRLQPIDAYDSSGDQSTIYANIVPDKQKPSETNINSDHPQQPVIYAELAATAPPVVNADNSA